MKYCYIGLILLTFYMVSSCNKEKADLTSYSATLTLVNAIPSQESEIKMNFTGKPMIYDNSKSLSYGYYDGRYSNGTLTFGVPAGVSLPLNITLAKDTTKPIFNQAVSFNKGDIYSLFITGYSDAPTAIFVKDVLPIHTDSTTGIRFINLSPNSTSVSINISGSNNGNEVDDLPYRSATEFIKFPADVSKNDYLFEIRAASTGEQLTTFYYNDIARLRNVTLVIRGAMYGDPGIEVVRINHY